MPSFLRKKAGRVWDSVPRSWWRQQAQERLKMSRWDIFRWRTLAGGRWCPVGTVQRRPRRQPRPLMASSMPRRFSPSFPVTPPQACTALWYKRRRGDTELCGALASCPLSRLAATASRLLALSVTAAAVPAPPKGEPSRQLTRGLQKAKSRLPLWGRCPPKEGGEGNPPPARTCTGGSHRRERSSPPQGAN